MKIRYGRCIHFLFVCLMTLKAIFVRIFKQILPFMSRNPQATVDLDKKYFVQLNLSMMSHGIFSCAW